MELILEIVAMMVRRVLWLIDQGKQGKLSRRMQFALIASIAVPGAVLGVASESVTGVLGGAAIGFLGFAVALGLRDQDEADSRRAVFQAMSSHQLWEIWCNGKTGEWSDADIAIVERILAERHVDLVMGPSTSDGSE